MIIIIIPLSSALHFVIQGSLGELNQTWDFQYHLDADDPKTYFQPSLSTHCKHMIPSVPESVHWDVSQPPEP